MLEYGSFKLLLLAVVALVVVGPKDFPVLLRTVGKYVGMIRKQAYLFREQWDEAMRQSELSEVKKQVEQVGQELHSTMRETEAKVHADMADASRGINDAMSAEAPAAPAPLSPAAAAAAAAAASAQGPLPPAAAAARAAASAAPGA